MLSKNFKYVYALALTAAYSSPASAFVGELIKGGGPLDLFKYLVIAVACYYTIIMLFDMGKGSFDNIGGKIFGVALLFGFGLNIKFIVGLFQG